MNKFLLYFEKLKKVWFLKINPVVPIIIFQPGKVGSLSVQKSLEEAYKQINISISIYHAHALNYLDKREEYVKGTRENPSASLLLIQEWRNLREEIDGNPDKKWNIVNLVRDPVAMKVSALFQLLDQHIPDWEKRFKQGKLELKELEELFFKKKEFGFDGLDTWYDNQIKALWGIDVFSEPFLHVKGYKIYKTKNINLMIVRLEDLNRVAQQAFGEFLDIKDFKIVSVNIGDDKPYSVLYNEFKKRRLPDKYIEAGYSTRYANHFYSAEEISNLQKKWKQQG